jgi:bacterial/archaeal transporter family-2 protein
MLGILFAILAGGFITLQGIANTRISQDVGTWQAVMITQFTGFVAALLIVLFVRDRKWREFKKVKPLYLAGGSFAAIIIFCNIMAIQRIGVTLAVSAVLIAELTLIFLIDVNGWFGMKKQRMKLWQFVGIGMMLVGVLILKL